MKNIHYTTGLLLTLFIGIHLANHFYSIWGIEAHLQLMDQLRVLYRNAVVETVLLGAVLMQIVSGAMLVVSLRGKTSTFFEKLHVWSGIYLAVFLLIHVGAVLVGRWILSLDTNFYFGAAGLNSFPVNLFFIPYYALAIIAFFSHLAAIHSKKMKRSVLKLSPIHQSFFILIAGGVLTVLIFYGLTNHFNGVSIPQPYWILIGK